MTLFELVARLRALLLARPGALPPHRWHLHVTETPEGGGATALVIDGKAGTVTSVPPTNAANADCIIATDTAALVELAQDPKKVIRLTMAGRLRVTDTKLGIALGGVLRDALASS